MFLGENRAAAASPSSPFETGAEFFPQLTTPAHTLPSIQTPAQISPSSHAPFQRQVPGTHGVRAINYRA